MLTREQWEGLSDLSDFRAFRRLLRDAPRHYERKWVGCLTTEEPLDMVRAEIMARIAIVSEIASWDWSDVNELQQALEALEEGDE